MRGSDPSHTHLRALSISLSWPRSTWAPRSCGHTDPAGVGSLAGKGSRSESGAADGRVASGIIRGVVISGPNGVSILCV